MLWGLRLLHFLPDADDQLHSIDRVVAWLLGGFLTMFFVQRFFHFHHHDVPEGMILMIVVMIIQSSTTMPRTMNPRIQATQLAWTTAART